MSVEGEVVYNSGNSVRIIRGEVKVKGNLVRITRRDSVVVIPMSAVVSIQLPADAEEVDG